jgi:hypothetical protein
VSRLELLLGDTRDVFDSLVSDVDRISSAHLIERLCKIMPRPWGEYGKKKKELTQNQLARLLKPLAIVPQVLRIGTETPSGYYRHQFVEAWERFLSPEGEFKPQHLNKSDEIRTSDVFQSSTTEPDVEVRKSQNSNNDGLCLGVEVGKGGLGQSEHVANSNGLSWAARRQLADYARAHADEPRQGGAEVGLGAIEAFVRERVEAAVGDPELVAQEFERVMAEVFRV